MKKILFIALLLATGLSGRAQLKYDNRPFLKEVKLWSSNGTLNDLAPADFPLQGKFFAIRENGSLRGLAYVGRVNSCRSNGCSIQGASAKGEFEYFDYFAILDTACTIQKISVYNYQATHGQQITAKSWLKQFIGFNGSTRLDVGKNVDAISGATTSVHSMTSNVQQMLQQLKQIFAN